MTLLRHPIDNDTTDKIHCFHITLGGVNLRHLIYYIFFLTLLTSNLDAIAQASHGSKLASADKQETAAPVSQAKPAINATALDIERLSRAKSLIEIYDLARRMGFGTDGDIEALSDVVTRFLQSRCENYACLAHTLKEAGFDEIHDVTTRYRQHPSEFTTHGRNYDRVIYSEQAHGFQFFGLLPAATYYRLYLFLRNDRVGESTALILHYEMY